MPIKQDVFNHLDALPRTAFREILVHISIIDEVSLSNVSKRIRDLVLKSSKHANLFPILKFALRHSPRTNLNGCRWDYGLPRIKVRDFRWDVANNVVRKLELIPGAGTPFALVRCISGIFTLFISNLVKKVYFKEGDHAEETFMGDVAKHKYRTFHQYARQARREIFLGAISIIPHPRLLYETCKNRKTETWQSPYQLDAIRCLKDSIDNLWWQCLVEKYLVNKINPSKENIPIIEGLSKTITKSKKILIQGASFEDQLTTWSRPKHVFYGYYPEIIEKSLKVDHYTKKIGRLLVSLCPVVPMN